MAYTEASNCNKITQQGRPFFYDQGPHLSNLYIYGMGLGCMWHALLRSIKLVHTLILPVFIGTTMMLETYLKYLASSMNLPASNLPTSAYTRAWWYGSILLDFCFTSFILVFTSSLCHTISGSTHVFVCCHAKICYISFRGTLDHIAQCDLLLWI